MTAASPLALCAILLTAAGSLGLKLDSGPSEEVQQWIKDLEHVDSDVRNPAAEALWGNIQNGLELGGEAEAVVSVVAKVLVNDDDDETRGYAALVLRDIDGETAAAVPALAKAMENDDDEDVRFWAAEALGNTGVEAAVPALAKALEDGYATHPRTARILRQTAAEALETLGATGVEAAVPALVQALKTGAGREVRGLRQAMGWIQDNFKNAGYVDVGDVSAQGSWYKLNASNANALREDSEAFEFVTKVLLNEDNRKEFRQQAADLLSSTNSTAAVAPLTKALLYDKDPGVREQLAYAFEHKCGWYGLTAQGKINDALIQALLDDKKEVRLAAGGALKKMIVHETRDGEPLNFEKWRAQRVVKAMDEVDGFQIDDKDALQQALGFSKDTGGLTAVQALQDEDAEVSKNAAEALDKISSGDHDALAALLKNRDAKTDLRAAAAQGLGAICAGNATPPQAIEVAYDALHLAMHDASVFWAKQEVVKHLFDFQYAVAEALNVISSSGSAPSSVRKKAFEDLEQGAASVKVGNTTILYANLYELDIRDQRLVSDWVGFVLQAKHEPADGWRMEEVSRARDMLVEIGARARNLSLELAAGKVERLEGAPSFIEAFDQRHFIPERASPRGWGRFGPPNNHSDLFHEMLIAFCGTEDGRPPFKGTGPKDVMRERWPDMDPKDMMDVIYIMNMSRYVDPRDVLSIMPHIKKTCTTADLKSARDRMLPMLHPPDLGKMTKERLVEALERMARILLNFDIVFDIVVRQP